MKLYQQSLATPLGALQLFASDTHLTHIFWPDHKGGVLPEAQATEDHAILAQAKAELLAYFAGEREDFHVPVAPQGTAFQRDVWAALQTIPFGETWTYSAIAEAVGRPAAVRAVGAANGRNPISIIIPCHRVIGANGTLTGYAGGLPVKEWLLTHEGAAWSKVSKAAPRTDSAQASLFSI